MKKQLIVLSIATMIGLSGCGNDTSQETNATSNKESTQEELNHKGMSHSSSGEVSERVKVEENPTYKVGSQATMHVTNHMDGMNGAVATIVGAYHTTVYTVSYTPTNGGEKVENHKWVIHEEIENAGKEPFKPGDEVVLNIEHMEGMDGATAVIDSAEQMTIYIVDYTDTATGEKVKNHKWVTENELSAK